MESAVREVFASLLPASPSELVTHEAYKPSQAWSAGGLVLKVNAVADVRAEAWALRTALGAGVPVPEVVAEGVDPRLPGGRYFVMTFVDGEELPDADSNLLSRVGSCLRKLHQVRLDRFGRQDAPADSWFDWLVADTEEHLRVHDEPGVRELLSRWRPQLNDVPCVLVHGDIQQCHVRVADGRIAGVIDFESSLGGDPAWELARFCTGVGTRSSFELAERMLPSVLDGYGPIDGRRLPLYRALAALSEVAFNVEHQWTEWIGSSVGVLRERVAAAH